MSVAELKAQGNTSFAAKDFDGAIKSYTAAIEAAEKAGEQNQLHVLYSNRSASYSGLKEWTKALEDADKTIELDPSFAKGYGRKGSALHGAHEYDDAIAAFKAGLEKSPGDAGLKKGLADVERAKEGGGNPSNAMGNMFKDPAMFQKLSANPKTAPLLADQGFVAKLNELQRDPNAAMNALQDPRMIQVMGVLMGIDLQTFDRPEDVPGAAKAAEERSAPPKDAAPKQDAAPQKDAEPKGAAQADEEMPDAADKDAQKAADEEKQRGNERYLKRDFDAAITHYQKAWELHKDITYLNNLGAVYFEQGKLDECIKTCEQAIEEGHERRADYKLVAKAYGRIGTAYQKLDNLEQAIFYFQKSLTEHRTPDILNRLRSVEKDQRERAKAAYIDPAKAEEERNRGNTLYKEGDFPGSVQAYTEAIRRNPSDPRGYTNRASAYTKLAALPEALKDTEEAIKADPTFVKAYIRKSNVLYAMKDYTKALEAIQRATDVDNEQEGGAKNQAEIQAQSSKCMNAIYAQRSGETEEQTLERAMRDPDVANIMQDPVMQSILQQAQSNPAALQDHMKNPSIRAKIQKLVCTHCMGLPTNTQIAAGIIRTR